MSLRSRIESTFSDCAYDDALFYATPIGLRFSLAGEVIADRAKVALKNATRICDDIFAGDATLVACLKSPVVCGATVLPSVLGDLRKSGVSPGDSMESWVRIVGTGKDEVTSEVAVFQASASSLPGLLWHAVTVDMGDVRGGPSAGVYLFNIPGGLAAHPYDDRGMDVCGPNRSALIDLSGKFQDLLLESNLGPSQ